LLIGQFIVANLQFHLKIIILDNISYMTFQKVWVSKKLSFIQHGRVKLIKSDRKDNITDL